METTQNLGLINNNFNNNNNIISSSSSSTAAAHNNNYTNSNFGLSSIGHGVNRFEVFISDPIDIDLGSYKF